MAFQKAFLYLVHTPFSYTDIYKTTLVPGVGSRLVLVLLQTADPYAAPIVEQRQLGLLLVLQPPVSRYNMKQNKLIYSMDGPSEYVREEQLQHRASFSEGHQYIKF